MVYSVADFWSSLNSLLITLACGAPPGWMRRSPRAGSCSASYTRWHGRTKFRHPQHCPMPNNAVMCLAVSFACALQKYLFVYLFIYLTRMNAEVLLGGVRLWLVHFNRMAALQCPWWLSLSTSPHWFSALLYTLTLYLTQLSLGFPISSLHFAITLVGLKTASWNFAIHRAGTWHSYVGKHIFSTAESDQFWCLK